MNKLHKSIRIHIIVKYQSSSELLGEYELHALHITIINFYTDLSSIIFHLSFPKDKEILLIM